MFSVWFNGLFVYAGTIQEDEEGQSLTSELDAECGTVLEAEFATNKEYHLYYLTLAPGDSIQVSAKTLGDFLKVRLSVRDPSQNIVSDTNTDHWGNLG